MQIHCGADNGLPRRELRLFRDVMRKWRRHLQPDKKELPQTGRIQSPGGEGHQIHRRLCDLRLIVFAQEQDNVPGPETRECVDVR